ncbi:MTAP family purine nucleoside phosphorylase [Simkania negevensis]|uniref:S-methyl-5'-thioadenosine phosphorylase n=1 Tax=Simkania negevensis TaxID=83561 RepID=A0ABS3APE1_9BACT|nr:MTAP family purine nucleoside phosphorylase [Simkania negevensis]
MWGIIGGTGFESFDEFHTIEELNRTTPFGVASPGLKRVSIDGTECLFLPRHGQHHKLLPSEVNYRANIYALKQHGATKIAAYYAVGSLREELHPGDMVVPTQFINQTHRTKTTTFAGDGIVGHVPLAKPSCQQAIDILSSIQPKLNFTIHHNKTYIAIEGPVFSTQAESNFYRLMKADIIGMTAFPEYALAREAGVCFLPCAFVTDFDCWDDTVKHVTIQQIVSIMKNNNKQGFSLLLELLKRDFEENHSCRQSHLANSLLTPRDQVDAKQQEWLAVLGR